MGHAERIVDGDGRREGGAGGRGCVKVGGEVDGGGGVGLLHLAHGNVNAGKRGVGVDDTIGCRIAHDAEAAGGFKVAGGGEREVAGAGQLLVVAVRGDEEAVAVEGDVRGVAGGVDGALRVVGGVGGHLDARAHLDGIAGAGGTDLLIEEIGELGGLRFEGRGVHVGQVVGNGIQFGGVGIEAGKRNRKARHDCSLKMCSAGGRDERPGVSGAYD